MTGRGSEMLVNKRLLWQGRPPQSGRSVDSQTFRVHSPRPCRAGGRELESRPGTVDSGQGLGFVSGPDLNLTGLSESQGRLALSYGHPRAPSRSVMPARRFLATFAGLPELDWGLVDLVIRADGGSGELPLPPEPVMAWESASMVFATCPTSHDDCPF